MNNILESVLDSLTRKQLVGIIRKEIDKTSNWRDECERLHRQGKRVTAIKVCRENTGWGLKESKEYCDSHWYYLVKEYRAREVAKRVKSATLIENTFND